LTISDPGFARTFGLLLAVAWTCNGTAKENWNNPPKEKVQGVEHATFRSASMKVDVGFNIYLPPQYAGENQQRFPVIYYLHGIKGNESSYLDYARLLDHAIKSGAVRPMILVFANGGETSFFSDSPDRTAMGETVVIRELIPHIDQHFRTIGSPTARSVHGFSMGGFGALKFAFKYPDLFGSVVSYGAILPDAKTFAKKESKIFEKAFGNEAGFAANDPFSLLDQNSSKLQSAKIQIVIGSEDELMPVNRKLHVALGRLQIQHQFRALPGVPHKKEPLYDKAAQGAFEFTSKSFDGPANPGK